MVTDVSTVELVALTTTWYLPVVVPGLGVVLWLPPELPPQL
jgi:hypothetical protein